MNFDFLGILFDIDINTTTKVMTIQYDMISNHDDMANSPKFPQRLLLPSAFLPFHQKFFVIAQSFNKNSTKIVSFWSFK